MATGASFDSGEAELQCLEATAACDCVAGQKDGGHTVTIIRQNSCVFNVADDGSLWLPGSAVVGIGDCAA